MAPKYSPTIPSWRAIGVLLLLMSAFFILDTPPITPYIADPNPQDNISGEGVPIELIIDYSDPDSYTQIINHPGASAISVHFLTLDLADGDTITITNPAGTRTLTYPGDAHPKHTTPGFWSTSVDGDTAIISLVKAGSSTSTEYGASIDHFIYAYGLDDPRMEGFAPETQVGTDDKQDVLCYSVSNPDEYENRKPVARVERTYYDGGWWVSRCTAWRVGAPDGSIGYVLTNNHCIENSTQLDESVFEFNYENSICGSGPTNTITDFNFTRTGFIATSATYDWTLLTITLVDDLGEFGWLDLDPRPAVQDETIYIPQHPLGAPKKFGIVDTENGDTGLCRIDSPIYSSTQAGYYCDTAGGSSGSPVIALDNHRVIALHHAWNGNSGDPMNLGIRIEKFWSSLDDYLKPSEVEDKSGPSGTITTLDPITYTWDNDATADDFTFVLSNDSVGTVHVGNNLAKDTYCSGDTCSYTPTFDYYNDNYEWSIRGNNTAGAGSYGDWAPFTIETPSFELIGKIVQSDFNGDNKSDPGKFYSETGYLWWQNSETSLWESVWLGGDTFEYTEGSDFDGDGITDPTKFYSSTGTLWWINSSSGTWSGFWLGGDTFDLVSASDFDGDGKTDPAKFYPSTGTLWWINSSSGTWSGIWLGGDSFDLVTSSDFDGDGKTDPAKFYSSTGTLWWVNSSSGTWSGIWLGGDSFDLVTSSDFDGDGKTDPAKFYSSSGTLWWVNSSSGTWSGIWLGGDSFDLITGSDFNGDNITDPGKYFPSTGILWWRNSADNSWNSIPIGF